MKRFLLAAMFLVAACGGSQSEPTPPSDPVATEPAPGEPSTTPDLGGCVAQGCSNTVCAPEGEGVMTTCEWKPEYACYSAASCERQPSGECGWTQTAELSACLANPPAGG